MRYKKVFINQRAYLIFVDTGSYFISIIKASQTNVIYYTNLFYDNDVSNKKSIKVHYKEKQSNLRSLSVWAKQNA